MGFLAGSITKEMLERERGVVQNEKRQGENQPYGRVFTHDRRDASIPPSHPYSWSTIGSMDDLNAASLEDVQGVVPHLLRPEQLRAVAGRRHHAGARARAGEEVLRRHPAGAAAAPRRAVGAAARPQHPRRDAGPRAAGAHLSRLPRAGLARSPMLAPGARRQRAQRLAQRAARSRARLRAGARHARSTPSSIAGARQHLRRHGDGQARRRSRRRSSSEIDARGRRRSSQRGRRPTSCSARRAARSRTSSRGAERLGGFGGRSDILAESMTFDGNADGYLDRLERMATRDAGRGPGRGDALARRAALHAGGHALPEARARPDDPRSQDPAAARRRAGGELPGGAARRRSPTA